MAVFGLAALYGKSRERNSATKSLLAPAMVGHVYDLFAGLVIGPIVKVMTHRDNLFEETKTTFLSTFIVELLQATPLNIDGGKFDPSDYPDYIKSAAAWIAFDVSARLLYDSGLTGGLYRLLHIQDRRLPKNTGQQSVHQPVRPTV